MLVRIFYYLLFICLINLLSAPGTKRSGIRYSNVLTDGQIDGIPREFHAFILVITYSKHTHIISVFLYL